MICLTSCFGRILEEHVNERNTVVFPNPCHMKVDHRGLYGAVPKTVFYGLDILSIFQKMCGERVAERMSCQLRVKSGTLQNFFKARAYKMIVDWLVRTETFKYEIHARVTLAIGLQYNRVLPEIGTTLSLPPLPRLMWTIRRWMSISVHFRLHASKARSPQS